MTAVMYNNLYSALHKRNFKRVRHFVLNEGISVNHQFPDGSFPLHIAAEKGDLGIAKFLLSLRASPDFRNQHGQTALILGICDLEVVEQLIRCNCKVNLTDAQKRTALHLAGSKGLGEVVECLINAGARVNAEDKWGRTPLHMTLLNITHNRAITKGFIHVIRLLLSHGADVNRADRNRSTPLFLAAAAGNHGTQICRLLVSYGAKLDKPSRHNLTPFLLATMKGYEKVSKLLIEYNCDVDIKSSINGKSSLYIAIVRGYPKIARWIVASGFKLHQDAWLFSRTSALSVPKDNETKAWLLALQSLPQPLTHMCRSCIRRSVGCDIKEKVNRLKYPDVLKQYILLSDVL